MNAPGPVVAVTPVGSAPGARALGATLACRACGPDRAALLVDLERRGAVRPTPVATAAARELEERLAGHLPGIPVASRGATCHLAPGDLGEIRDRAGDGAAEEEPGEREGPGPEALRAAAAALPLVRDSAAVLLVPPSLLLPLAAESRMGLTAALLRAELPRDRSLTALAARELIGRGLRVAVAKRAPGRPAGVLALLGAPVRAGGLPDRMAERLLAPRTERSEEP